jgi:hypothetical protein
MRSEERGRGSGELLWIAIAIVIAGSSADAVHALPFTYDDIKFWVGTGANRAALVIDWVESAADPPALVWGYRWDGAAKGQDMLTAIVAADPRLFAKLGGSPASPNAVYGLGYDSDNDGEFGINDGTVFDAAGIALSAPADLAQPTDPGDYYAEGWFTGFWHYGVENPAGLNPYLGGGWSDTRVGMAERDLVDGAWDSWVFSPTFDFAAFAENPVAATPPYPPGDFNFDGHVNADDFVVWRAAFGSTTDLAADANGNGAVDAADYVVWRKNLSAKSTTVPSAARMPIPEPSTILISLFSLFAPVLFRNRKE